MRRIFLCGFAACLAVAAARADHPANSPERKLYDELNALRADRSRVYHIRQFALRRDAVRLVFEDGTLGLLEPFYGRVLGAIFSGSARVLATPRDPAERRSLSRFLGAPLLDTPVSKVYLRFTDGTAEEIEAFLRSADAKPVDDPAFAADWNSVLGNLNPASSLRTLRDIGSPSPLPFFEAALAGSAHGVFEVSVDDRRLEQILMGQVKYREGGRYYDLWAMFPRAEGPGQPEAVVPVRYSIETTVQDDLVLRGRTRMVLRALRDGERILPLILSHELRVQSVSDAAGRSLDFFQNEDLSEQEVLRRGDDLFYVVLPEPTRAGEEFQWEVKYSGNVITEAGNGVYYVGERGAWYPRPNDAARFCSFELTFHWPRKLNLVATGKKTEEHEEGEWRTGRWTSDVPMALAGFNLGSYTRASAEAGAVHITVNANQQLEQSLYSLFRAHSGLAPASGPIGWRRTSEAWKIANLATTEPPPMPAAVIGQLAKDIGDALRSLEQWNGPFPFARLEVSPLPAALGQSWPGLIYLSTMTFVPKDVQQRAGIDERARFSISDLMPFHELAHQWWGNLAGSANYRDEWIMEGLANYCALLYLDTRRPGERVLAHALELYRGDLLARLPDGSQTVDQIGPLALGQRLDSSLTPNGFSRVTYAKGTWVVHMLRMMWQDPAAKDPDARFRSLLHALLGKYRFATLSESDLRRELARIMTPGMDLESMHSLDWFFDQWVHATGIPHYSVDYKVTPGTKGVVIQGTLRQEGVPESFLARVPLYRANGPGKPVLLGWVTTSGTETAFRFHAPVAPEHIVIDPGQSLLAVTQ
jgi:hypothetical protein